MKTNLKKGSTLGKEIDLLKEIHTIDNNVAMIRQAISEKGVITIRADQLMDLAESIVPIKCISVDCLFSKNNGSCFISPVELEEGICRYYRPTKEVDIDRIDLPGGFTAFINELRAARRVSGKK